LPVKKHVSGSVEREDWQIRKYEYYLQNIPLASFRKVVEKSGAGMKALLAWGALEILLDPLWDGAEEGAWGKRFVSACSVLFGLPL
jgi:hypothetical protein